eukprot:8687469-Lingulodinium_polyedra.AAC.1
MFTPTCGQHAYQRHGQTCTPDLAQRALEQQARPAMPASVASIESPPKEDGKACGAKRARAMTAKKLAKVEDAMCSSAQQRALDTLLDTIVGHLKTHPELRWSVSELIEGKLKKMSEA